MDDRLGIHKRCDVRSLSEILGHKNVSFTLNVYGSANMQQKIKCMNLLNELL